MSNYFTKLLSLPLQEQSHSFTGPLTQFDNFFFKDDPLNQDGEPEK